jgi:hypothetical protein
MRLKRTLSGPVRAEELSDGFWRLTVGAPDAVQVYLRFTPGTDCAGLQDRGIRALDLQWLANGVSVRVAGTGGVRVLEAETAILHEAQSRLYDALPLTGFDAKARRFWQRVFWLIRVPGGRYLLRLIARRRR